jgi:hypothetical protein
VQALSLMKACANKSSMVAEQGAWVVELEDSNDRLLAELEQVHLALNEAIAAQNSLFVSYEKLEEECIGLHAAVDTLEQEKAKTATDHEAEVAATHKKNRDYRIGHRKRLREPHMNLEKVMNEIGVRCLPYPRKKSTIGEIITWFDTEI